MEENEDEPKDVREATPVEDDIRKGEMNEAPEDKIRIRKSNSKYGTKKRKVISFLTPIIIIYFIHIFITIQTEFVIIRDIKISQEIGNV